LSIGEACEFLGVSRANLYTMMTRGDLESCKIGGARRVPRRAVVALAAKSLVSA
jgi:excisionase family DNA binding protein